jgi:hypothetical protein
MIGKRLSIAFSLIVVVSILAFGTDKKTEEQPAAEMLPDETSEEETVKASYMRDKFQFTTNAGVGLNSYQWHFTGGFQVDFNANPVIGAGIKTTIDYGLKYDNLNINIYALYKVWWFYFGPGVSFIVQGMTVPADDPDYATLYVYDSVASLALTGGFRFPVARIGPGFMTMDLSVDWYQTDIPLSQPTPPFTGTTLNELIDSSTYAFKFALRMGYTF